MPLTDEEAAARAVESLSVLSEKQIAASLQISSLLHGESTSPLVDVHELFALYNTLYFRDVLLPRVEVSWSKRLTLCAGICELIKDDSGKYRRIRLKLSEPLLKYRTRDDTVNTLLHEAVHAYFFITSTWRKSAESDELDRSGHGASFQIVAEAINQHGSYDITIYHEFHDEVESYRTHVWQCDGPCQTQAPYFGLVKRTMNRPPGKSDSWWQKHESECGGIYTKISEPELTKEQIKALSAKKRAGRQKNKLDSWIQGPSNPDSGRDGMVLEGDHRGERQSRNPVKRRLSSASETGPSIKKVIVSCPICEARLEEQEINNHLDEQHVS